MNSQDQIKPTSGLNASHEKVRQRRYVRPTLRHYGDVTLLTASGTGSSVENNQGQGQTSRRP